MSAFVRQSQLGMGERSLNQLANAEIRRHLDLAGMVAKRTVIYSTRIDGDTGTVVAQVSYGPHGGPVVGTTELTILFHRSVWSVGQVTPGARNRTELGLRRRLSSPLCPHTAVLVIRVCVAGVTGWTGRR
jgi:hypothetical protein